MRVIACIMVIAIHVCNIYNRAFPDLPHTDYIIAALINAASRVSVPIFFMISGALMAGRTPDLEKEFEAVFQVPGHHRFLVRVLLGLGPRLSAEEL